MKAVKVIFAGLALVYIALIGIAYLPYQTTPVKELAANESEFIKVNGHNIHFTKKGQGEPLILVHGFAGSTYTWRKIIPLLADNYTVYALDLLGFGLSDKPPRGHYDMRSQGNLIIGFMDALQLSSATLAGHSMGGVVVGCAALAAPSKVDKLVLIEPGFYTRGTPAFLKYVFFPLDRIMARQFYSKKVRTKFLQGSFYNKSLVTDEVLEAYMVPTRTPNAVEALARMMTSVGSQKYDDITVNISQPTLLVWGQRQAGVVDRETTRIKSEIQGCRLVSIKECGHYVQEERPRELIKTMIDFLKPKNG